MLRYVLLGVLLGLCGASPAFANTYATNFPATENPLSESTVWKNGKADGVLWNNLRTAPGLAFGTQPGTLNFDDSLAILAGPAAGAWGNDQMVQIVAKVAPGQTLGEVEALLRFTISSNNAHGYEVNWNTRADGSQYCQIVKWNGGLGSFTILGGGASSCPAVTDGTVLRASVSGSSSTVIKLFHCGLTGLTCTQIASVTDSTSPWLTGSPGIGTYLPAGSGLDQSTYGIKSVIATDGTIRQAATCGSTDVQTQLTASITGDVVLVPGGTCTWNALVDPGSKSVVLMGKGAGTQAQCAVGGQTTYSCITMGSAINTIVSWTLVVTGAPRITGLTFDTTLTGSTYPDNIGMLSMKGNSSQYRVDHNNFYSGRGAALIHNGYVRGVIDHNNFIVDQAASGTIIPVMIHHPEWGGVGPFYNAPLGTGDHSWASAVQWGNGNSLFFEDNFCQAKTGAQYCIDGWKGQRYVARFNTLLNASFQNHGTDSTDRQRGGMAREVYLNTCTNTVAWASCVANRGGPMLAWGNVGTSTCGANPCLTQVVDVTLLRLLANGSSQCSLWGCADDPANNTFDQGAGTSNGYAAMDQPGRGQGDLLSGESPKANITPQGWPHQALEPIYAWNNDRLGVNNVLVAPNNNYIQEFRDYYTERTTFNGTTTGGNGGVGVGPRASRPATCTTGVAWWATDDSNNWNTTGADGALDKCVATNTWISAVYVPYTYPHPLTLSGAGIVATPDTTAPTTPSGLVATASSATQINVSWTGSTDNVGVTAYLLERCQGVSCAGFAQITSTAGVSVIDTGLTAGTSYSYRVRATDAASNLSGYSNTGTATTPNPDVTAPSVPTSLVATPISKTQINLAWTASTDNVAVAGYQVVRCTGTGCSPTVQIGAPTPNAYSDLTVVCGTTYTYGVRAVDTSNNVSALSTTAAATSLSCTTPPLPPSGVTLQAVSDFSRDTGSWSWTQGAGTAADGFHVKCGKDTTLRTVIVDVPGTTTTSLFIRQFLPGQGKWFCTVVAYNAGGESTEATEANTNVIGPGFGAWGFAY